MCYLRHLHIEPQNCSIYQKELLEESSEVSFEQNNFNSLPLLPVAIPNFNYSNLKSLSQLFDLILANSRLLQSIQTKLYEASQMESNLQNKWLEEMEEGKKFEENLEDCQQKIYKDEVIMKLFESLIPSYGENHFKFKLSLDQNLPSKLYKNRKMKINVKLLPCAARSSKIVYNSNPLHICIGIFDKDGNWVQENIQGEPIINGETQVNLYQGKAEFSRLLFNQISSNMPKQKMNIAIYVKPTGVLIKDNSKNTGNNVDWRMIKPLTLKNVQILSKKRKKMEEDME